MVVRHARRNHYGAPCFYSSYYWIIEDPLIDPEITHKGKVPDLKDE